MVDAVKGIAQLRLALSTIKKTSEPLSALTYILEHRAPKDLAEVERLLIEHLASVEDALAVVRRMQIAAAASPTPLELSIQREDKHG